MKRNIQYFLELGPDLFFSCLFSLFFFPVNYHDIPGRVFTEPHILNSDDRISCQRSSDDLCQKSHFKSNVGAGRKQNDAACIFLAFIPSENSFHCQCCKRKTMFVGRYSLTQNSLIA